MYIISLSPHPVHDPALTHQAIIHLVPSQHLHHASPENPFRREMFPARPERQNEDNMMEYGWRDEGERKDRRGGHQVAGVEEKRGVEGEREEDRWFAREGGRVNDKLRRKR
jgi:hypothetical protein